MLVMQDWKKYALMTEVKTIPNAENNKVSQPKQYHKTLGNTTRFSPRKPSIIRLASTERADISKQEEDNTRDTQFFDDQEEKVTLVPSLSSVDHYCPYRKNLQLT